MGLFDRLSRVVRANLNDMVSQSEDPEKMLDQIILEMEQDLVQLRQAVARAIAHHQQLEQQYTKSTQEVNNWDNRAKLALSKGDENLAREGLIRKKSYADTVNTLKQQLAQQTTQIDTLKRSLIALENKISEAKTKKDMLKARANGVKAQQQLQNAVSNLGTSSAMAAFERMEQKVIEAEARSQSAAELGGAGLEEENVSKLDLIFLEEDLLTLKNHLKGAMSAFERLEQKIITLKKQNVYVSNNVDDELEMMKIQLSGMTTHQQNLEISQSSIAPNSVVDAELEELRNQLNKM